MSWTLHRWVWRLKSPLFVGFLPSGALNRCRLYIPAHAMWGALTAELARARANGFPEYVTLGTDLKNNARFSYMFPAQQVNGRWQPWLPRFVAKRGLFWRREDLCEESDVADRVFRRRLLWTRPGTAIDPNTDSALDGSLRETECVARQWRTDIRSEHSAVAYVGHAFTRKGANEKIQKVKNLFVGGDSRYGLGSLRRVKFEDADKFFGMCVKPDEDTPGVVGKHLLAHAHHSNPDIPFLGMQEALVGRDRQSESGMLQTTNRYWVPGSVCHTNQSWEFNKDGTWKTV